VTTGQCTKSRQRPLACRASSASTPCHGQGHLINVRSLELNVESKAQCSVEFSSFGKAQGSNWIRLQQVLRYGDDVVTGNGTSGRESFLVAHDNFGGNASHLPGDGCTRHRVQDFDCRVSGDNTHRTFTSGVAEITPNDVASLHQSGIVSRANLATAAMIASS